MDNQKESRWTISYGQIGLIILTFSLGVTTALLFSNSQAGTPTTFTATELIGFMLSVLLSGASIVLAVTAIALGKSSEQSIVKRSDESIRLQNEVFMKTTEALQRIESSTGVTEKRIEDIISGRVGDISHQVAEMAVGGGKRRLDVKELEEGIRRSLMKTIRSEGVEEDRKNRDKMIEEERKKENRYQESHQKLLLAIGNRVDVEIEKIGHGNPRNEGEALFDALYKHDGKRIALSTFREDSRAEVIQDFITNGANEILKGLVQEFVVVIFSEKDEDEKLGVARKKLDLLKEEISNKIQIVNVNYERLVDGIKLIEI